MTELYPPQKAAVEKLVGALRRLRVAGNWSVTGTGKTLVGMDWLESVPDNANLFIDEGGLTLFASVPGWDEQPYLCVGGEPEEEE